MLQSLNCSCPHEEDEECCGAESELFLPPTNPVSNPQPSVTHTIYMTPRTQCPLYRTDLGWARGFICEKAYRNPRKTLLGCKSEEDWRKIGGPGLMGHGRPKKISFSGQKSPPIVRSAAPTLDAEGQTTLDAEAQTTVV